MRNDVLTRDYVSKIIVLRLLKILSFETDEPILSNSSLTDEKMFQRVESLIKNGNTFPLKSAGKAFSPFL